MGYTKEYMDAVEDIKQRLSIEDVVADYVTLKRSGSNFKGLSPFSNERTPSFMVSPEKQIWHDFSSGKGGDAFSFVMEMEGVDFKGALELLARKAGIDLSLYQKGDGSARKNKDAAQNVLSFAVKYYQQALLQNPKALDYVVNNRKLRRQTIADFGIGYAPNTGTALVEALQKKKMSIYDIQLAGVITSRYSSPKDMFRGRIVIPLMDPQGQPIGFTARLLDSKDAGPKYINTPQTILYDKSRHVFGLHAAKDTIRTEKFVVIVEGNMDVISSHQAGVKNVVATAGTAMTTYQLKALQRFTNDIRLCFDQDAAGIAAAERAIDVAQSVGVQLSIISLPEGKDPDELIQKDVSLWQLAITKQQYAVDWLIDRYKTQFDIASSQGKKQFIDTIAKVIVRLQNPVEKDHYTQELAKITNVDKAAIIMTLKQLSNKQPDLKKVNINPKQTKDNDYYQDNLLALLVGYSTTRRFLETSDTSLFVFSTPERQRLFEYIQQFPNVSFAKEIPEDLKDIEDYAKIVLFKAEELYAPPRFNENSRLRELQDLIQKLKINYIKQQRQLISEEIKQAELAGDQQRVSELLASFIDLNKKG